MKRILLVVVAMSAAVSGIAVPSRASGPQGPALSVPGDVLASALHCPASFTHPDRDPVLLVHGTTQTAAESWAWNYWKVLPTLGFDTCGVDLPNRALGDMQIASEYVVYAVRAMAAASGRKIDVIGHSQGGEEPRWAIKWWPDVQANVDDYIGIASPDQGDANFNGMCAHACWPSAWQERDGAAFITALNAGDQTPGEIDYTSIYTLFDQFVEPEAVMPESGLEGGTAIAVQRVCPGHVVDHISILGDAVAFAVALDALTHAGTANIERIDRSVCLQPIMPGVDPADELAMETTLYTSTIPAAFQQDQAESEPPLAAYAI